MTCDSHLPYLLAGLIVGSAVTVGLKALHDWLYAPLRNRRINPQRKS